MHVCHYPLSRQVHTIFDFIRQEIEETGFNKNLYQIDCFPCAMYVYLLFSRVNLIFSYTTGSSALIILYGEYKPTREYSIETYLLNPIPAWLFYLYRLG